MSSLKNLSLCEYEAKYEQLFLESCTTQRTNGPAAYPFTALTDHLCWDSEVLEQLLWRMLNFCVMMERREVYDMQRHAVDRSRQSVQFGVLYS